MATIPDEEQVETIFKKYDVNEDGKLSAVELKEMIKELEIELEEAEFEAVFEEFDADGNNFLDPKEFSHFVYVIMNCDFTLMASMLFYIFDIDHSASIDRLELKRLILSLGFVLDDKEVDEMMDEVGTRGKMNYQEFLKFIEIISE